MSIAVIFLVRFAFLNQLDFPLYHDSAVHYQIIEDLQNPDPSQQSVIKIGNLSSGRYYHIGFHSTVVVLAAQLRDPVDHAKLILITGHLFLLLFALNLGILAARLFKNSYAGLFTLIFAGLGWSMPAYAVNWGKYPGLASLALIPLAVYWLTCLPGSTKKSRQLYIVLFCITASSTILLHSRSLILLTCCVAVMLVEKVWKRLAIERIDELLYVEMGIVLLILYFHPNLHAAALPYLKRSDLIITLLAVLTMFIVIRHNKKAAFRILTFLMFVAMVSIIPTPGFMARQAGPDLLDRPFLQIFLFVPLSLFAGAGLSYFILAVRSRVPFPGISPAGSGLLVMAFLIMIRPLPDYKPNPCCIYMQVDDIFLIGWMEENLPLDSRILISTDKNMNAQFVRVATDAGGWITPLTKLKTIKFDYQTDFSDPAVHTILCQQNISYIYRSAANTSFSIPSYEDDSLNYSSTIVFPSAQLYSVNCHLSSPASMRSRYKGSEQSEYPSNPASP